MVIKDATMKLIGIKYEKAGRWSTATEKKDFLEKQLAEIVSTIGHLTDSDPEDNDTLYVEQVVKIQEDLVAQLECLLYYATNKVVTLDVEYIPCEEIDEYAD